MIGADAELNRCGNVADTWRDDKIDGGEDFALHVMNVDQD